MKILKNSTYRIIETNQLIIEQRYNDLLAEHRLLLDDYNKGQHKYREDILNSKLNFQVRRFVIGAKGSGKTTFVKSLLPKMKNPIIFSLCDEYKEFSKTNQNYIPNPKNSLAETQEKAEGLIEKNKDSFIIIDDITILNGRILSRMMQENYNFIIVCQKYSQIMRYINYVDFIYDLGTTELSFIQKKISSDKIAYLQQDICKKCSYATINSAIDEIFKSINHE